MSWRGVKSLEQICLAEDKEWNSKWLKHWAARESLKRALTLDQFVALPVEVATRPFVPESVPILVMHEREQILLEPAGNSCTDVKPVIPDRIPSKPIDELPLLDFGNENASRLETSTAHESTEKETPATDVQYAEAEVAKRNGELTLANMPRLKKCDKGTLWILSTSHEMEIEFGWAEKSLQSQRNEGIKAGEQNEHGDPMYGISSKGCPRERDGNNRNEVWHLKAKTPVNKRQKG